MSDSDKYLNYILSLLRALKPDVPVGEGTDLVGEFGLSSLQVMELIEQIEDQFDTSIPLNILPDVNTVGDLARKLRELNG